MSRRSHPARFLVAAVLLAACGGVAQSAVTSSLRPSTTAPSAAPVPSPHPLALTHDRYRYWLLSQSGRGTGQIRVVDGRGATLRVLPMGVPAADWSRIYAVSSRSGRPMLETVDSSSGITVARTYLGAAVDVSLFGIAGLPDGLASGGRRLVLSGGERNADGRLTASRFVVVDLAPGGAMHRIDLAGDFQYDGLSPDGRRLYLLENVSPPGAVDGYRVRVVDVDSGHLAPIPLTAAGDLASGTRGMPLARSLVGGGRWLATLFVMGDRGSFVQLLDLERAAIVTVDLTTAGGDEALQLLWSLAPSPGGGRLAAVNGATGNASVIDLRGDSPRLLASAAFSVPSPSAPAVGMLVVTADAKRFAAHAAVMSPDGAELYVVGEQGVVVLDPGTLRTRRLLAADLALRDLGVSQDGRRLAAIEADSGVLHALDLAGARSTVTTAGDVSWLLRVEGG